MRFLFRFALLAAALGLVLGWLLRRAFGRKFFRTLCVLSLAPLPAHAIYLGVISWRAGAQPATLLPFGLATLALVITAAVMASRWAMRKPILAAFTPLMAGLAYLLITVLMWNFGLNTLDVVPNALAGAIAGQACIALFAALLVFVPQSGFGRSG